MGPETVITLIVGAKELLVGIVLFFLALLAIIWKGKKEISEAVREETKPISKMTNAVIEMQRVFEDNGIALKHHLVETPGSPLGPTGYGKKLIVDSGLEKILDDNKQFLISELRKLLPEKHTEYDVQEKARSLMVGLKDNEMMNPIKTYAYENGLNVEIILKAGGLWLRDDFLGRERIVHKVEEKDGEDKKAGQDN